ncbi:MAG: hypothetical protein WBW73_22815 [Rhodoplanes sp.]
MNKPLRSIDVAVYDETAENQLTFVAGEESTLKRLAQSVVNRARAAEMAQQPDSANTGSERDTGILATKGIQESVSAVARAKHHLLSPSSMNSPRGKMQAITFSPIQEWEGYVVEVKQDHIVAHLVDLTAGENRPTSTVDIPFEEFSPRDVERLRPGKVFRWAIGYLRKPGGTRMRGSEIVFRDLPQWTKSELAEARKKANEMADFFASADRDSDTP